MNTKQPRALVTVLVLLACAKPLALHAGDTGQGPEVKMRGSYENRASRSRPQTVNLQVTPDKLILKAKDRPETVSLDYKVIRVEGSDVTVEVTFQDTAPSSEPFRLNLVISVRDDLLYIEPNVNHAGGVLGEGGVWARK